MVAELASSLTSSEAAKNLAVFAGMFVMMAGVMVILVLIELVLYIYTSLAFMYIGKKAQDSMYGIAWIPWLGPKLIAFRSSGMHWWPWLLLSSILITWIPFVYVLSIPPLLVFFIYHIIWRWKLLEKIGIPGWWSILMIIPIVNLVLLGIAAWREQ